MESWRRLRRWKVHSVQLHLHQEEQQGHTETDRMHFRQVRTDWHCQYISGFYIDHFSFFSIFFSFFQLMSLEEGITTILLPYLYLFFLSKAKFSSTWRLSTVVFLPQSLVFLFSNFLLFSPNFWSCFATAVLQHFWIALGPVLLGCPRRDGAGRRLCVLVLDLGQEQSPHLPSTSKLLQVKIYSTYFHNLRYFYTHNVLTIL